MLNQQEAASENGSGRYEKQTLKLLHPVSLTEHTPRHDCKQIQYQILPVFSRAMPLEFGPGNG